MMNRIAVPADMLEVTVTPKFGYGYIIKFTTWENDGDHYATKQLTGIQNRSDVDFWVALSTNFRSVNGGRMVPDGIGNDDVDHDTLVEVVKFTLGNLPGVSSAVTDAFSGLLDDTQPGALHRYLYDTMLGYPVDYDFTFCRAMERVQVHLIQPMCVDVADVIF